MNTKNSVFISGTITASTINDMKTDDTSVNFSIENTLTGKNGSLFPQTILCKAIGDNAKKFIEKAVCGSKIFIEGVLKYSTQGNKIGYVEAREIDL